MKQLLIDFGKKIVYGFGFGIGMGIPYYISRKSDKKEIYYVKLLENNETRP